MPVTITSEEYNRLLQNEVQLQKYKMLCQKKTLELKRVHDQLSQYKRQALKRSGQVDEQDSSIPDLPDTPNVKKNPIY